MSATEQLPSVDVLDDETQRTPAWEQMREQQRKTGTLPRGIYDAEIRDIAIVRRRDDGSHVLRVIARATRLKRDGLTWQGLSSNPDDPFDLDARQVRALRKFAERLGLPTPCPAVAVVEALRALMDNGEVVQMRVTQTPVGQQATLSREVVVLPVAAEDPIPADLEGAAADAHAAHAMVLEGLGAVRLGLARAAEGCHHLHRSEGWLALGHETLTEYLAAPEVTLSRSEFYRLSDIWQAYIVDGGLAPLALQGASPTKLEVPLPALTQGVVTPEQAVADATAMPRTDLRKHYQSMLGGDEESEDDAVGRASEERVECACGAGCTDGVCTAEELGEDPAGGTDDREPLERLVDEVERLREENERLKGREMFEESMARGAAAPEFVDAAHGVTTTLRRVLVEIGDPKQKRMGKQLRQAVMEALAQAEEHGLGELGL